MYIIKFTYLYRLIQWITNPFINVYTNYPFNTIYFTLCSVDIRYMINKQRFFVYV